MANSPDIATQWALRGQASREQVTAQGEGTPTHEFRSRVKGVRRTRDGWTGLCPAHEDKNSSLSFTERDGKILVHCFAGCETAAIVGALGLRMGDLFVNSAPKDNGATGHQKPVTVAELAAAKKLPLELLQKFQLTDTPGGIRIPYWGEDGDPAARDRMRTRLEHVKGWCWWTGKGGRIVPYGVWLLDAVRKAGRVVLVEGETDFLTLWHHRFAALGIPGADMVKVLGAEHLQGIGKIFVLQESDAGGANFVTSVSRRLKDIGWKGETRIVSLAPVKDANELHCADPEKFKAAFQAALDSARSPGTPASATGFTLTPLGDLMSEPEEQVSWLLEGILPAGGLSLLAAKPKTGKSTLARCLALMVSRGERFLGRETQMGAVIYLALEEKRGEVRAHFQVMGATGNEPIFIHAAHAPADALPAITIEVKRHSPVLLIVDPLLRFTRVKDGNDYAQVTAALEPLLILARENSVHVLLVHHLGKGERAEATDGILGSTALFAAVDTALIMKRSEKYRTIQSRQRYGEDLVETVLVFNPESRTLSLGTERSEADEVTVSEEILKLLEDAKDGKTEAEINEGTEGKTKAKCAALRKLLADGKVCRKGTGKRGDPYFYFSPSQHIPGSREVETQKADEPRTNIERNLLPKEEQKPILLPEEKEAVKTRVLEGQI